jgi:hypothetical protein
MLTEMIDELDIPNENYNEHYDTLRNWLVLSKYMQSVNTVTEIIELMHVEVNSRRRPDILMRLHARYNAIRREYEREELVAYLASTRK